MISILVRRLFCSTLLALLVVQSSLADSTEELLLDFERPDIDGNNVRLSDYRDQWVVVNFWATWCGPCVTEIPELQRFHDSHGNATVIGVNFETIDTNALRAFIDGFGISYPVVRVGEQPLIPFEPLKGLPSSFVISPSGSFVTGHVGPVDCHWLNQHTGSKIACTASATEAE